MLVFYRFMSCRNYWRATSNLQPANVVSTRQSMPFAQTLLKWQTKPLTFFLLILRWNVFLTWNLQMIIILTANVVGVYLLWPDRKQVSDELKGPTFSALCDVTLTRLVFAPFQLWKIPPNFCFEEAVNSGLIYSVLWKSREFLQLYRYQYYPIKNI